MTAKKPPGTAPTITRRFVVAQAKHHAMLDWCRLRNVPVTIQWPTPISLGVWYIRGAETVAAFEAALNKVSD